MSVTAGSPQPRFQERVSARCGWVKHKACTFLTPRQLSEATGNTVSLLARQHLPLLAPWGRYAPSTASPIIQGAGSTLMDTNISSHPHQTILSSPGVSVSTEEPEPCGYSVPLVQQQTSHTQPQPIQMEEENRESESPLSGTNVPAGS